MQLLISSGTMVGRSNGFNYRRAFEEIRKLYINSLCSGCELMMLNHYYDKLDSVADALSESGVPAVTIHCEKDIGSLISDAGVLLSENKNDDADEALRKAMELFGLNCIMAEKVSAKRMVLHLWGGYSSDKAIDFNISVLDELAKTAHDYGVRLLIENIPSNTYSPRENWRKLLPVIGDCGFVFDTRFGKLHEETEKILTDKDITGHIEHIHISDYTGGYKNFAALRPILHPGEGVIDFDEVARLIKAISYDGTVTLESPVMEDDKLNTPKLSDTVIYLRQLFGID